MFYPESCYAFEKWFLHPWFTQGMLFPLQVELKKFSVATIESAVKMLVVSARLVSPSWLNLASGSWMYSSASFHPYPLTGCDWSNSCQDVMPFFFLVGAAMLIESLLSSPLSSSISDCHQPSATANEPTSECSCTSTRQSSPHCCAPEQGGLALLCPWTLRGAFKFELWVKIMTAVAIVKKKASFSLLH